MSRELAVQCAVLIADRVGYFTDFQLQRLEDRGVAAAGGVLAAAEFFDGEETLSCVFACSADSVLIPIFMGVPPFGDMDALFGAVLRGASRGAPSMAVHHSLRLTDSPFFSGEGIVGVALLPAATLGYLRKLPSPWAADDGLTREFVLPVFLDAAEYSLARTDMAALMDELDRSGRDLMSVRRRFC